MSENLRFTGENPPLSLWAQFPNWQNAYDEEDIPGQDETTLRPADNQRSIDDDVSFTADDILFPDGQSKPAFISVINDEIAWIFAYPNLGHDECWVVRSSDRTDRWVAMNDDWFIESDRRLLRVPTDAIDLLPLRVSSRLPLAKTGQKLTAVIEVVTEDR